MDNLLIVTIALYVGAMVFMFAMMFMSGRRKQDAMEHTLEIKPTPPEEGKEWVEEMIQALERDLSDETLIDGVLVSQKYGTECFIRDGTVTIFRERDHALVGVYHIKIAVGLEPEPGVQKF
jgi:hypothetical protein